MMKHTDSEFTNTLAPGNHCAWRSRVAMRTVLIVVTFALFFGGDAAKAQGTLDIGALVQIGSNYIDFGQIGSGVYPAYPGYGTFSVTSANGFFSLVGITPGESGSIQSLNETAGVPYSPEPGSTAPFMTFTAGGANESLYLTALLPGITAGTGPLTITDTGFGSVLSFQMTGFVWSSATNAQEASFLMLCAGQVVGVSPAVFLASLPRNTAVSCTVSVVQTPQQTTQTLIEAVNALYSPVQALNAVNAQGVLNGGQDNSLVKQLQQAINLMNAGKNAEAIDSLNSFIAEVNDLLSSGVLTPSEANPLISAAQSVIARLS